MTSKDDPARSAKEEARAARKQRLSAALRANLHRRKGAARASATALPDRVSEDGEGAGCGEPAGKAEAPRS